ncbi:hypothetical protein ACFQX6_56610 [Streptosporangium lutulentum]
MVSVIVDTSNTRQVRLRVVFRASQTVRQAVVPLSGRTSYTPTVRFAFPRVACGTAWSVVATGDPAGASGSANGRTPPCPEPTAKPTATRTVKLPPAPRPPAR